MNSYDVPSVSRGYGAAGKVRVRPPFEPDERRSGSRITEASPEIEQVISAYPVGVGREQKNLVAFGLPVTSHAPKILPLRSAAIIDP
jgi:hypothetical protein